MKYRHLLTWVGVGVLLTPAVGAETHFLRALMDGDQANGGAGTGSPGTGVAMVSYDDASNQVSWAISWEGLVGVPNAMHFHGPAEAGSNAGVAQDIGVASNPATGTATITAAQGVDLLRGLWYVNLHTSEVGGGEIRGQVLPADLGDDFSGDLSKWAESTRGLENNAAAGYDAPDLTGGELTLGGTTNNQYWFGNTLESVAEFDSRLRSEVRVTRVSLNGSGSAWRSSLWIIGDADHYLHYSQNVGETGWSWNARDDGGAGTQNPTGGGANIASLDGLDNDSGSFEMGIRIEPRGNGAVDMTMLHDGVAVATHSFTNFPVFFKIGLTGQARAGGDTVSAVFDDLAFFQESVDNLAPGFVSSALSKDSATVGVAYSATLAGDAVDPEEDPIEFSKVDGPAWLQVAADGTLSGTPGKADAGINQFAVQASDEGGASQATLTIRVLDPGAAPIEGLFGWWPLNEGSGSVAKDISGNGRDAVIIKVESGGLGAGGSAWIEDAECGMVLSFNGDNGTGSYAIMTDGNPGTYGALPLFTNGAESTFTWSLWVKAEDNAANNDIILGNRYRPGGGDWSPREFIKFDSNNFEFDANNVQGVDYEDIVGDQLGRWVHHVVVKEGSTFTYYRDGVQAGTGSTPGPQNNPQPLFFGGQGDFGGGATAELWRGALFDVRLFTKALSADEVLDVFNSKGVFSAQSGPSLDVDASGDDLVFTWESRAGKLYALRSAVDPAALPPVEWGVLDGNLDLVATPPENSLAVPRPADPTRFFVVEEYDAPPVSVFSDDLEGGQGEWMVGSEGAAGTAWELGSPTNVGPVGANSGANCFGTNLAQNYAIDANVWLRSPVIDLSAAAEATLKWAQFTDIESGFDAGSVRVLDAADDSFLADVVALVDGVTSDWENVSQRLPAAAIGKMIRLEFRLATDNLENFAGFYVDDIEVTVP